MKNLCEEFVRRFHYMLSYFVNHLYMKILISLLHCYTF
jgi:hypothetical protein